MRTRKVNKWCFNLLVFCLQRLISAVVSRTLGEISILTIAADITLVLILASQVIINADLRQDRSWSVADADVPSPSADSAAVYVRALLGAAPPLSAPQARVSGRAVPGHRTAACGRSVALLRDDPNRLITERGTGS